MLPGPPGLPGPEPLPFPPSESLPPPESPFLPLSDGFFSSFLTSTLSFCPWTIAYIGMFWPLSLLDLK